jgi:hypothetical protein
MKEVFFGALVDQVGPAYSNGLNILAMESNIPGASQQPNGGQFQWPTVQQLLGGQVQDQALQAAGGKVKLCRSQGGKVKPYQWQGASSDDRGTTTSTAITKCPCRTDSSAANFPNYSAGCATASSGNIQYFLSNASVGPKNCSFSAKDH